MTGEIRLVTADDLCVAAQTILEEQLGDLIDALGLGAPESPAPDDEAATPFEVPETWTQVPTETALQSAETPAGAISSPGTIGAARTTRTGVSATWRIRVAMFDRGTDYNDTAHRVRTWAALIRGVMLRNPGLGGLASGLRLATESYRLFPETGAARTLGGCAVEFDVDVQNIADLSELDVVPVVATTHPHVTVARPY